MLSIINGSYSLCSISIWDALYASTRNMIQPINRANLLLVFQNLILKNYEIKWKKWTLFFDLNVSLAHFDLKVDF